jgi:hypothetical protein
LLVDARENLDVLELGQVTRERVVELEFALLVESEERNARDRLRHREQAEVCVLRHRLLVLDVGHAVAVDVHDLAAARDQSDHTGDAPGVHPSVRDVVEPAEPLARHADALRGRARQVRCERDARCQERRPQDDQRRRPRSSFSFHAFPLLLTA